ncbi:hypothetical protein SAMN06296416_102233 [Pseudoxanthomonas wuyuanensis]|uniref:Uncharacterized protein n=2 Tax=Pseudoxanthomonas wuyuanensis TaxID=1073196 RepID=A0A286D362_9GAMM|nr:hypothetical protein CSC75_00510 [Pseudoxanthomonas wuyuanensis]SOD53091.1 hypothetical protein SAMN06296416_102233 [Pseudoxanthomonas wuyuanensis]
MGQIRLQLAACAFGWLIIANGMAQDMASQSAHVATEAQSADERTAEIGACCPLAEGTPLVLELLDPINSASSKRGDRFRLRLAEAVLFDDTIALPAGIEGVGEVVHAERSRGGGKPGELLLAARYLSYRGQSIKLRGLKLGGSGRDTSHVALAVATGAGPFAHFIRGKEIEIPAQTLASAKLGEMLRLPPAEESGGAAITDPMQPDKAGTETLSEDSSPPTQPQQE